MNQLRKTNGITLVTLVITIVVMLIVASIVVATIIGQGETIEKTNDAKIYTELKQLQEEIEKYKVEHVSNKSLRKGDFSGKASNEDLITEEIAKAYANIDINKEDIVRATQNDKDKENVRIGVIDVGKLANENKVEIDSTLGEGSSNTFDGKENLNEFSDVFAIDVTDNTLYYANNGKVWKLGNDKIIIPKISVSQTSGEINKKTKLYINVEGEKLSEENEYKYYFSENEESLNGALESNYTSGIAFTFDGIENNTYYLFVKEIKDDSGNVSQKYGEKIEISGANYHRFGPYTFTKLETDDNDIDFRYIYEDGEEINDFDENNWFNRNIKVEVTWGANLTNKKIESNSDNCVIDSSSIIAKDSQKITVTATGTNGNVEKEINLKIDKNPPVVVISENNGDRTLENGTGIIRTNISITDDESGINYTETKYGWSDGQEDEPINWISINSQNTNVEYEVSDYNNHYLWVKTEDITGNKIVEKEKFKMAEAIAKVSIGAEETVYFSLQEAFDACPKDGTKVTVELLKDIDEATSTYAGQDILLNLAAHNISNTDETKTTIVNNGSLQIVHYIADEIELPNYNAKIEGNGNTVIQNNAGSTLTLGTNDDTVLSGEESENFTISGTANGVVNSGILNYYDGVIKGIKSLITSDVNTPVGNNVITIKRDNMEISYLGSIAKYAARIGNIYYPTLQLAVNDCKVGETITLVRPNSLTDSLIVSNTKDVIIDLDNYDITSNAQIDYIIKNSGRLNIISTNETKKGSILATTSGGILNDEDAYLKINGAQITISKIGTKSGNNINYEKAIYNKGELFLEGAANINSSANYTCGIYNEGTFTNNGGNLTGESSFNYGKFPVINKGEYINNSGDVGDFVYNDVTGIMKVNDGTIKCIYNYSLNELLIKGGTIYKNGTYAIINKSENGVIKIKDNAVVHGIQNDNSKGTLNLTIEGGTINDANAITSFNSIYGYYGNTNVNISDGTIGQMSLGSNLGNLNITGGTINKKIYHSANEGNIIIESGTIQKGIENKNAQITIGKNDGNIRSDLPRIEGGITTTGDTLNFYDGTVVATSTSYPAIKGGITAIAEGAEIEYGTESGKEKVSLKALTDPVAIIVKSGANAEYNNLQSAINAYNGEESGIIIARDFATAESVEIINGKNILIDLNGKNISAVKSNFIINNGILTIKDSLTNGKITSKVAESINNNGTLELQNGSFICDCEGTNSSIYKHYIINKGTFNLSGAVIKGTKQYMYLIKNEGTFNFTTGTIGDTVYKTLSGIYNTGTCNLTGGIIQRISTGINNSTGGNVNLNGTQIKLYSGNSKAGTGISNTDGNVDVRGNSLIESGTGINDSSKTQGTINIYNGTINGNSYGIQMSGKVDMKLLDGTISASTPITISGTVDFDMDGGKLQGTSYGISLSNGSLDLEMTAGRIEVSSNSSTVQGIYCYTGYKSNQDIKIKGGTITATSTSNTGKAYGIRMCLGNSNSQQKLTIGTKDGVVNNPHDPVIIGKTYGVYNEANREFNFYDGIIKTANLANSPIQGNITEWEDEYKLITDQVDEYNVTYLGKDVKVAQIVGGESYTSLEEAIGKCAKTGKTEIELLGNTTEDANMEILANQEIILDLKGKTVTVSNAEAFTNNGIFKITDSIGNGSIDAKNGTALNNKNQFTLESGNINIDKAGENNNYVLGIVNSGTFNIDGGSIKTNQSYIRSLNNTGTINMSGGLIGIEKYKANVEMIYNEGNCNLNGGEIKGGAIAINNRQNGNLVLNSVTIDIYNDSNNKAGDAIKNNDGEIEIKGTTLIEAYTGITDASNTKGTIKINGGEINTIGAALILSGKADVTITAGTVQSNNYAINATSSTKLTMSGGKLISLQAGIRTTGALDMTMTGGTIEIKENKNSATYGIDCTAYYGTEQIIKIRGGTISSTYSSNTGTAYGIKMSNPNNNTNIIQRIILGEDDGNINNPNNPVIIGKTKGIYNESNKEIYFYDGIVTGQAGEGSAIDGNVTAWADGYQILTDVEEGVESAYLGNDKYVAQIGENNKYYTLKDAFLACNNNEKTTIKLLRNIINNSGIEISTNKDIVLDLNGKTLLSTAETGFTNNGKFEIVDSEQNGIIKNTNGIVLENNNLFTLTSGTISIDKRGVSKLQQEIGISNNSVMNIVGGNIRATKSYIYAVYNQAEGIINLQGGTIGYETYREDSTGIYNLGTLNLTGGVIKNINYGISNVTTGYVNLDGTQIKIYANASSKTGYGISNQNGSIDCKGESLIEASIGIYDRSSKSNTTKGLININGGNINVSSTGIDAENSEINMISGRIDAQNGQIIGENSILNFTGGEIVATSTGINLKSSGNCNINGGNITSTGYYGVNMAATGKLKIEKGSIIVNNDKNDVSGIYYYYNTAKGGTIQIEGGIITATSGTKKGYGINLAYGNPNLIIGIKDKTVRKNNPVITGNTCGVYNSINKNVYFYDGTIKGQTASIFGIITQVEDKNTIIQDVEDDYIVSYLETINTDMVTAFVTGTYYETLQQAFNACQDNVETYVIMANGCSLDSDVQINSTKNIVLDLNGYSITSSSNSHIVNNGRLKIIDTSDGHTGSISDSLITGSGTYTRE